LFLPEIAISLVFLTSCHDYPSFGWLENASGVGFHGVSRTRAEKPTLFFENICKNFIDTHNALSNKDLQKTQFFCLS